jgi:tetratricopeptide (TPR) repeat protein
MVTVSIESLCIKARQAVAKGDHALARQLYQEALGIKADAPDVHYGLATVCFLLNDLPSAAYHFKEVTRLDPLRAGAHINLGAVYNRLDQVEDAIQALRRGIQLDTHRAEGYYNLGLAYKKKKQMDLAIQAYHEATRLNPRMPDAHLNLANAYLDKGQFGQAVSHYSKCLEIRPDWPKAESGLAQAEAGLHSTQESRKAMATPYTDSARLTNSARVPAESDNTPRVEVDPNKTIDPVMHSSILSSLHQATIEAENQNRSVLQVFEKEVEPAIKELSNCLLNPNGPISILDECVEKFENAIRSMRTAKESLQTSVDQVRRLGTKLVKS